jgi:beta-lactamase class A
MLAPRLKFSTVLVIVVTCSVITYFTANFLRSNAFGKKTELDSTEGPTSCEYNIDRLDGYQLIKPIVYAELNCESAKYESLKEKLTAIIDKYKVSKKLTSASVYLRVFGQGNWMSINSSEAYYPGSLLKVVGLFTYLKISESQPGLLDKKLSFDSQGEFIPDQTYNSKHIEQGKKYTIRQLLKYMISYSDNNATFLLQDGANMKSFDKVFTDLKIQGPVEGNRDFKMTAKDYSMFLIVLYNATYLNRENSEFALELLKESDFNLGIVSGVPKNTLVVHKFGEMWDSTGKQLHESGLIYTNNTTYLLTVMTKGQNSETLPSVISGISREVYDYLEASDLQKN